MKLTKETKTKHCPKCDDEEIGHDQGGYMFLKIIDSLGNEEIVNINNVICLTSGESWTTFVFVDGTDMMVHIPIKDIEQSLIKNGILLKCVAEKGQ